MKSIFLLIIFVSVSILGQSQTVDTIYLWPNEVPGLNGEKEADKISDNTSKNVIRLAEVTNPYILVYHPKKQIYNASLVVCPGGGYHHLSINIEGFEIAEWVNELGITAYVLAYRVPNNKKGALQDAQRALRIARAKNPEHLIGIMGFSAGGSLSARSSTLFNFTSYKKIDNLDELSCKPDFAGLIYPAYLDLGENRSLTPEITIQDNTPTMFIFGTADDKYGNSALVMTTAMRDDKRPVELHFLPKGGHGYGMRSGNIAAETWPPLFKKWLINEVIKNE